LNLALLQAEIWAKSEGYDIAPTVVPPAIRQYPDLRTQGVYEAWNASLANTARMQTGSNLETEALREKIFLLASDD
jgi:hypothetical protein